MVERPTPVDGDPPSGWAVLLSGLVVYLLLVALERAFAMVFVLNFSTAGPGPTVLFVLLLLSGFAYPLGLYRTFPHSVPFLDGALLLFTNLVLLSLFPHPSAAALASLLAVLVATPFVFALIQHLGGRFAEGVVSGILLYGAGRAWLDTAPYAALASGWMWATVGAVAAFAIWILFVRDALQAVRPQGPPRPHLFTPFLLLMYGFLGSPIVVALWTGRPLLAVWGAHGIGLLLGIVLMRLPLRTPAATVGSAMVFAVAFVLLVFLDPAVYVAYPVALATAVHLLAIDLGRVPRHDIRRIGIETGVLQTVALVALFLMAVAPSWAFLPAPVARLAHGNAPLYLTGLALLVAGVPLLSARMPRAAPRRIHRLPLHAYMASIVAVLVVTTGGLVIHERPVTPPDQDAPPLRVATYNIHQYFSSGQTGHYNLETVAAVIRASGADVVGLQETEGGRVTSGNLDGVRWLGHELDMYRAYGPPASEQMYGVALLSRFPIMDSEWIPLPAQDSVERAALRVMIDAPFGPTPVIVTHLQTEEFPDDRIRQVQRLLDVTADLQRAWLLGDFNSPARNDDDAYALLSTHYADAWVASGRARDTGDTALDDTAEERIDHIFLHGEWQADDCRLYGDERASDHALVACDISPQHWPDALM